MKRIIIIVGIIFLLTVVTALFIGSKNYSAIENPVPPESTSPFPDSQEVTTLPGETSKPPEVQHLELTPENYKVTEIPTSGLLTTVVAQNTSLSFDGVLSEVFLDVFWRMKCEQPDGKVDYALVMTAKPGIDSGTIDLARYAIRNWESNIAQDIGQSLFPNSSNNFRETVLEFSNYAPNPNSRFSTFLSGGAKYEIYYGWILNFAVFATSHNCQVAVVNDLYAPQAH